MSQKKKNPASRETPKNFWAQCDIILCVVQVKLTFQTLSDLLSQVSTQASQNHNVVFWATIPEVNVPVKMKLSQVSRSLQHLFKSGQVHLQTLSDFLTQVFTQVPQNHNVVFWDTTAE